ncbi:DnaJ domain-containing protein [Brucepastera parasyntrophica]|uniref:J domain-containing protein n=1 Tax=Brucepastera parasyntrophica TaxID=2880008 RepID=UPI00210C0ED3|nr:DnaJ domain-containing protein [Brucepastera parasyntrophica]ULQ60347.1 DnaJ domain-containing protein [Brucepastera parasyntrophica]
MNDCYQILGVTSSASAAEIKRAFRIRAKEIHPDIPENTKLSSNSDARMRELIHAYKTLSDSEQRAEFDVLYTKFRKTRKASDSDDRFDYRLWLMNRDDKESRAKLIFFDLLHDLEEEAVQEFQKQRKSQSGFILSQYFDREDFMDCGFILAEELALRADYYEAFLLLAEIIFLEQKKPYFRHFFPEVLIFTRDIIKNKLLHTISDELMLDSLETALELQLGKKDDAYILKLMAGCYERIGDKYTARLCLAKAMELDPALSGVRTLRRRLEV